MSSSIEKAAMLMKQGEVIAYPTEAVVGLGCDPFNEQAVKRLFHVKQRPYEKGVILIAANIEQIRDMVELDDQPWQPPVEASWPGPITWVLPAKRPCQIGLQVVETLWLFAFPVTLPCRRYV